MEQSPSPNSQHGKNNLNIRKFKSSQTPKLKLGHEGKADMNLDLADKVHR